MPVGGIGTMARRDAMSKRVSRVSPGCSQMRRAGSGWRVIVAYALVCAATQVLWLTYAAITTETARHYGVSVAAVGWLAEIFPLLYVVLAIPAGILLDRWFRPVLAAGGGLVALGGLIRLGGTRSPGRWPGRWSSRSPSRSC